MSVQLRPRLHTGPARFDFTIRAAASLVGASAAVMLAGCSASITRFDNPSFALGEGAGSGVKRSASGFSLEPPPKSAAGQSPGPQGAPARSANTVEVAALPAIQERPAQSATAGNASPVRAMAVTRHAPAPANSPANSQAAAPMVAPGQVASAAKGEQIEVQPGDTLYGIGKRHKVLISDLMAVNELRNPNIKPGQKLYLPSAEGRATPKVRPERTALLKPQAAETTAIAAPSIASVDNGSTYVVKPGDSLFAIAAKHKIKVLDLQRANDITDVSKMKPGTVLKLPSAQSAAIAAAAPAPASAPPAIAGETIQPEERIVRIGAPGSTAANGVKVLNGGDLASARPAAAPVEAAVAATPAAAKTAKLRWPVRGRVVQGFGTRSDGSHNDGVDIAVPAGTDVLAAEDGVIAYAGNEVKTYGNLVLVRHDNGWVTAYANNEKLLVQRGDRVKRGQPVAKAGKSGGGDQPHVHFEVRVGSKPVDPLGYLENM
jgi:murein DD-endopeptidase MepM/ murein hydrolase activator NlpD